MFQVDIYLVVKIGCGIMFDYVIGIVVGEMVVIENDVLIL